MNGCTPIDIGLHACASADESFCGVNCDMEYYDPSELIFLHVILRGRPNTLKSRVIQIIVNGSVADQITIEHDDDFIRMLTLNNDYMGLIDILYVENGCPYWKRSFSRGTCIVKIDVNRLSYDRLISNLRKLRGQG